MVRVSDEEIQMVINDVDGEWELDEQFALDLRDARTLLAWIEQQCRREYHSPEDLQRTILAELEGDNE